MFTKLIPLATVVVLAHVGSARAQFLDMSQMVQNELNFQRQFYDWARQGSLEAARWHRLTGTPIPFNAATLSQANLETQRAYEAYNQSAYLNSARMSQAVSNWTNGAIRGVGPYTDPTTGATYQLPWTHNQYHLNQWGQFVPGYNPYRMNVYPY